MKSKIDELKLSNNQLTPDALQEINGGNIFFDFGYWLHGQYNDLWSSGYQADQYLT